MRITNKKLIDLVDWLNALTDQDEGYSNFFSVEFYDNGWEIKCLTLRILNSEEAVEEGVENMEDLKEYIKERAREMELVLVKFLKKEKKKRK